MGNKIGHKIEFLHAGQDYEGIIVEDDPAKLKNRGETIDWVYKAQDKNKTNYFITKNQIIKIYE